MIFRVPLCRDVPVWHWPRIPHWSPIPERTSARSRQSKCKDRKWQRTKIVGPWLLLPIAEFSTARFFDDERHVSYRIAQRSGNKVAALTLAGESPYTRRTALAT